MAGNILEEIYEVFRQCGGKVTTDTRSNGDGALFFALRGQRFDGNRFAEKALASGSCAVVIDDSACYKPDGRHFLVDNALYTLQSLATKHRQVLSDTLKILAVTGTNGKTTTKELIKAVLREKFGEGCLATEGNLNNEIGVPLTLLGAKKETSVLVLEMGANHPGEIARLSTIAQPNCGLITNVGRAHLEGFGTREKVFQTKKELFDNLLQRKESFAFVNEDDRELLKSAEGLKKITYGTKASASVTGKMLSCNPYLVFEWCTYTIETHIVGGYNLYNALAAVAVGQFYGVSREAICRGIAGYKPSNNRSQLQETGRNILFIDAYNANPDSMNASLRNFSTVCAAHKAVILGDMLELGHASVDLHAEIVELLRSCYFEKVYLCGKEFFKLADGFSSVKDFFSQTTTYPLHGGKRQQTSVSFFQVTEELIHELRENPIEGYHILIKGSRGMSLEKVVAFL
ncbi:MAG: UDP-N-acetylmuramoyl-tripeptide--D-alanyl-D-alanine ligase [Tannerellaceae bacterium]|jgi:UDP-N-acetylmuramoyl-tripeptide--D-alanyl-D-alanine ligase|nr:UDP-N-acetylmuramoyl-tripeptide--D-alanyl-D-alanine ligase [Tannerellaceae bacterium]